MSLPAPQLANILAFTKGVLGLSTDSQNNRLEMYIKAEFAAIERYCERSFLVADYIERFIGAGQYAYFPNNDNIRSIASFTANNSDLLPLRFSDYAVYFDLPIPRVNCTLIYSAGLDDVPDDIIAVIGESVAFRFRESERIGMSSKGMAGETTSFRVNRWSPENLKTIDCYKRGYV